MLISRLVNGNIFSELQPQGPERLIYPRLTNIHIPNRNISRGMRLLLSAESNHLLLIVLFIERLTKKHKTCLGWRGAKAHGASQF